MAITYETIARATVGSGGAATIEFTNIPSTFTDLCILVSGRITTISTAGALYISTNLTGYSQRRLESNGSTASSTTDSTWALYGTIPGTGYTANTFGSAQIYISNYAGTNFKPAFSEAVSETNATLAYAVLNAALISSTGAITSITLSSDANFVQHSTATLYGIKNTV